MDNSVEVVKFHDDELIVLVTPEGEQLVALKPMVEGFGMDWSGQRQAIMRDPVLSEGVVVMPIPTKGGLQNTLFLPLRLIHGWLFKIQVSRVNPEAQPKLLTYQQECYPVLFNYFTNKPKMPTHPESLEGWAAEIRKSQALEAKNKALEQSNEAKTKVIEEAKPKVEAHDALMSANGLYSMRNAAKILGTGQNKLFKLLREHQVLMHNNIPYQSYINSSYLVVKSTTIRNGNEAYPQTFVTPKGLIWLRKRFFSDAPIPKPDRHPALPQAVIA